MTITTLLRAVSRRAHQPMHHDPVRDWFVLLTVATVMLVGITLWNIWAFGTVSKGGTIGRATTRAPRAFDQSVIVEVRSVSGLRATEEAKYVTGVYRYADPSQ